MKKFGKLLLVSGIAGIAAFVSKVDNDNSEFTCKYCGSKFSVSTPRFIITPHCGDKFFLTCPICNNSGAFKRTRKYEFKCDCKCGCDGDCVNCETPAECDCEKPVSKPTTDAELEKKEPESSETKLAKEFSLAKELSDVDTNAKTKEKELIDTMFKAIEELGNLPKETTKKKQEILDKYKATDKAD